MLKVNDSLQIPEDELHWSFARASGPGGQNVNKVASKAVLRWNLARSRSLPDAVRYRLYSQQRRRITGDGDLIVNSQRFRDQERNRRDCLEKLRALVKQAALPPRPRKGTKPTRASQEARLQQKRRRSGTKAARRFSVEE
jgi:ribosome-associated protein